MNVRLTLVVTSFIIACTAPAAQAITSVKKVNLLHSQASSPFFTLNSVGGAFTPYAATDATFTPVGTVQAGQVASLTTNGAFSIVGDSTSAGGWTDGNGIPAGITLTFNTSLTIGMPSGTPAGYVLTNPASSGQGLGNGIGIAQSAGVNSTIDSPNQTTPTAGFCCEALSVSAMNVTGVNFSGSLTEPGFNFTPGTVGNFGPYVIQSNDFVENVETAGLWSENGPTDPLGLNRPTIGFGVPTSDPSEVHRGEGVVASHTAMENTFGNVEVTTTNVPTGPHQTWFLRQVGAWTFATQNARVAIKGIGYEYDVNFNISPIGAGLDGDFNGDEVVDSLDYVVWRMGFNGNPPTEEDFDLWLANYGNTGDGSGAAAGSAVPEPATIGLVIFGVLACGTARRAKR